MLPLAAKLKAGAEWTLRNRTSQRYRAAPLKVRTIVGAAGYLAMRLGAERRKATGGLTNAQVEARELQL